ncbi:hypothetical protein [Sulfurimonas sp.]|uniref:hypothetical protein n=1 Tax=Sulfurimonas sp. TaxID=2022749 RepID=UPI0025D7B65A|nr:hypothetical protein [Sulfurimonas sp.]MDD5156980.1 hypothetical protein [Sulfurimonas sp.]
MRLENFLALTNATLINEPCINSFENIIFEASKVKRGDLFFAYDSGEIELAVLNGAYGVVFDTSAKVSDSEIAWVKVDNLDVALNLLIRFKMIEKEVTVYECNEIILKLSLQIITQTNFLALSGNVRVIFKELWNIEDRATVLFCPTLTNKDIFVSIKELPQTIVEPIEIMEQTLFETSFIFKNIFYERQLLSPFFIPYLEELLNTLEILKIEYRVKKFVPIEHFMAVFTNRNFEPKEFGTSDKVLIFEKNSQLIHSEIKFLQKNANWAKIIYIIPKNIECENDENIFYYKDEREIIEILKSSIFHFALIVGVDKSLLNRPTTSKQQLLFEF